MRIAIVDDQANDARAVEALCASWADENHVELTLECFHSGEGFLAAARPGRFSLVFLDIFMNGANGIETARALRRTDMNCLIVFLTASREHMAQAFPCHAFDYVEKPAQKERVYGVLRDALALKSDAERCLELPAACGGGRVPFSQLVAAESGGNYVSISLSDGRSLRRRMTFTELSRLMEGDARFLSTIRGVILNMDYIDDLSDGRCVMRTGAVFPVKLRDGAEVEAALNRYRFDSLRMRQGGYAE